MATSLPDSIEDCSVEQLQAYLAEREAELERTVTLAKQLEPKKQLLAKITETQEKTRNLKAEISFSRPESPPAAHSDPSSDSDVSDLLYLLGLMRGTKVISGKAVKASDRVLKQVKWAHQGLKFSFCPELLANEPTVDELPFPLLIAGELGVIMSLFNMDKAPKQVVFRLKLLEKMAYWYQRLGDCQAVTAFYSGALRNIECGRATWSTPTDELETSLLALARPRHAKQDEGDSWVSEYDQEYDSEYGNYSINSSYSPSPCAVEDKDRGLLETTKL